MEDLIALVGWPILDRIRIGSVAISPHGIGIAVGYLLGAWWMLREGPKRGVSEEHIGTILLWALVGAIIGARLFFVLGHFDEFQSVGDMFAVWRGGISLIGGITGAMMLAYPFMRKYGYRFTQVMDSAAIGLAFGIAVGRIGDLVIGDHLGKPTDFFAGFRYTSGQLPGPWQFDQQTGEWIAALPGGTFQTLSPNGALHLDGTGEILAQGGGVHQTALYDLVIAGLLFGFLWWLNRKPRREGVLIATFAIWYGAGRVLTDFLRVDKTWLFGLTGSQWASVAAITIGVATLVRFAIKKGAGPVSTPDLSGPSTEFTPPGEPSAKAPGGPPPP